MFVPQTAQQVSSAGGSPAVLIPPSAGKPDPVRPGETGVTDSVEPSTEEDIWGASQLSPGPPAMFVPMASPSAELVSCQGSVSFDAGSSSPESSTPPHMFMPTAPGRDKLQDLAEQSTDTSLPAVMDSHEDSAGHDITLSGNAGNRNPASPPRMFTPMMPNWSVISAIDSDVVASTTADGMPQFRVASTCSAAASSGDAAEGGPPGTGS